MVAEEDTREAEEAEATGAGQGTAPFRPDACSHGTICNLHDYHCSTVRAHVAPSRPIEDCIGSAPESVRTDPALNRPPTRVLALIFVMNTAGSASKNEPMLS